MLLAGADAVEVGTATLADPRAVARVQAELELWCARHDVGAVRDLVGAANDNWKRGDPR
jgi:dihydroorotate dehydrogenase (NAD+) catalytic subunit